MNTPFHIFTNIVKDENSLTELTYNLLQYKFFKDIFFDLVFKENLLKNELTHDDIKTQQSYGDHGRPDLVIENKNCLYLVEIKVYNTARTPNQPSNYLKYLLEKNLKEKACIFLLTKDYYDQAGCLKDFETFHKEHPNSKILTNIIYWEDLLIKLKNTEVAKLSPIFQEYQKLLEQWFFIPNTNFSHQNIQTMYSDQIPNTLRKVIDLIFKTKTEIQKRGYSVKDSLDKYFEEHGFYIKNKQGEEILFFGCWLPFWEKKSFPLILCLETGRNQSLGDKLRKISQKNTHICKHHVNDYWNGPIVCIEKELLDTTRQNEIADIVELYIKELCE